MAKPTNPGGRGPNLPVLAVGFLLLMLAVVVVGRLLGLLSGSGLWTFVTAWWNDGATLSGVAQHLLVDWPNSWNCLLYTSRCV